MKRNDVEKKSLGARVNRLTGQLKAVGRMIDEDRECPDVLHTISAIHAALRGLEGKLLEDHLHHCVCEAARDPKQLETRIDELIKLFKKRPA